MDIDDVSECSACMNVKKVSITNRILIPFGKSFNKCSITSTILIDNGLFVVKV